MKKSISILLAFIAIVCFVSCAGTVSKEGNATTMSDPVVEYTEELVSKDGFVSDYDHIAAVRHFKYRNHSYIQFDMSGGHYAKAGVIHDPDCRCKK